VRLSGTVGRFGTRRQHGRLSLSGPGAPRGQVLVRGASVSKWRFRAG
jgi:hypothetical protein